MGNEASSSRRSSLAIASAASSGGVNTPMVVLSPAHHPAVFTPDPAGTTDAHGRLSVPQPSGRLRIRRSSDIGDEITRIRSQSPNRLKIPGLRSNSRRRKSADEAANGSVSSSAPLPKVVLDSRSASGSPKKEKKRRPSRPSIFPVIMGTKRRASKQKEEQQQIPGLPPQASSFFLVDHASVE